MKPDEIKLLATKTAYEVQRVYCQGLLDHSQPSWDQATEEQRASAWSRVAAILRGNGPRQLHNGWLARKLADGWKHGPVKDPDKKEHPRCLLYCDLPPAQRFKDTLFVDTFTGVLDFHRFMELVDR